ncbi:hypothetical protein CIRG_02014 [Coccidioides immitis RMSCC 2394]|uniref:Uncharacterized protein n=1 Tax=Coccidioides immitis RMSCC 2394 TaxID=404692 RepID=A0A0J6Y2D7_COCIT|nr:hypothetical protein CIRG_02014 [Coccidioides immitis RMSCC 2394]
MGLKATRGRGQINNPNRSNTPYTWVAFPEGYAPGRRAYACITTLRVRMATWPRPWDLASIPGRQAMTSNQRPSSSVRIKAYNCVVRLYAGTYLHLRWLNAQAPAP